MEGRPLHFPLHCRYSRVGVGSDPFAFSSPAPDAASGAGSPSVGPASDADAGPVASGHVRVAPSRLLLALMLPAMSLPVAMFAPRAVFVLLQSALRMFTPALMSVSLALSPPPLALVLPGPASPALLCLLQPLPPSVWTRISLLPPHSVRSTSAPPSPAAVSVSLACLSALPTWLPAVESALSAAPFV